MAKRAKRKTVKEKKAAKKAARKATNARTTSTSEVGHAKNVANFATLISYCVSYGTAYNPSATAIKLPGLNTTLTAGQTALTNVISDANANTTAINARLSAFTGIKKLATRMLAAFIAAGASKVQIANAKTINRKIQGTRAKAATTIGGTPTVSPGTSPTGPTASPTGKVAATVHHNVSASQQSFDQEIQHFTAFVTLLGSVTAYNPNEADLKTAALNTYLATLNSTNTAAVNAHTALNNALIARNKALYAPATGLCAIAEDVKSYVKSVYGYTAPEYKQVSKLKFKLAKS
jgi:hypothetical protein